MFHQDWKEVILRKPQKQPSSSYHTSESGARTQRLENDVDGPSVVKKVPKEVSQNIIRHRTGKGMTQSQLAKALNLSDKIVKEWETSGKANYDSNVLQKEHEHMI